MAVQGQEKMKCHSSNNEAEKIYKFPLPLPFILFMPSTLWMMTTPIVEDNLFYEFTNSNANLTQKHSH